MKRLTTLTLSLCLLTLVSFGQTATVPSTTSTPCAAGTSVPYTYFGSAVVSYNSLLGAGVAAGSSFGVKTGSCSNIFLDTTVWTGVTGAAKTGYSLLTETLEYDLVKSGNWVFGGDGAIGVTQVTTASGSATSGMFSGGAHGGYDIGSALSKGKTHLMMIVHANYSTLTNNAVAGAVKANYWAEFRKTF